MSFRRSDLRGIAGARWIAEHKSLLIAAGLPPEVFASERSWNYVLLHGDVGQYPSGWQAEWLTPRQAEEILAIILPELKSTLGYSLVQRLQTVVRKGEPDSTAAGEG